MVPLAQVPEPPQLDNENANATIKYKPVSVAEGANAAQNLIPHGVAVLAMTAVALVWT